MYTVYCLYSQKYDKIYIGFTNNLIQRFYSHNKLCNKGWTIKFRPWVVLYTEVYHSKTEAMKREKKLKTYRGRLFLREIMSEYFE
jgi:putative endonuclease